MDVLRRLDRDGDGTVTMEEFRQALPLLGFSAADTEAALARVCLAPLDSTRIRRAIPSAMRA